VTSIQNFTKQRDTFDFGHKTPHMGTKPRCHATLLQQSGVAPLHTNMTATLICILTTMFYPKIRLNEAISSLQGLPKNYGKHYSMKPQRFWLLASRELIMTKSIT